MSSIDSMSGARQNGETDYRGNQPKSTRDLAAWLALQEATAAIEPDLPIVDPHHHLFGTPENKLYYQLEDLQRDLNSGHRIVGTVYVEAYDSGWRKDGPEALRPVGEVEWIADTTKNPVPTDLGPCQAAAGIVCHADFTLGDAVEEVLRASLAVSQGRLRGVRQRSASVEGVIGQFTPNARKAGLLVDLAFRRGFNGLKTFGLSFDAWIYHTQLDELIDLVDSFPDISIIVNHMAGPIGVAEFRSRSTEVFAEWAAGIQALADRPNVTMKIGGMGMPLLGLRFEQRKTPPDAVELAQAWRPYIEACVDAFGTSRCMFESNFPVDKQSCSYVTLWNAFKLVTRGWSLRERSDLFYGTACRTYRLPDLERLGDSFLTHR